MKLVVKSNVAKHFRGKCLTDCRKPSRFQRLWFSLWSLVMGDEFIDATVQLWLKQVELSNWLVVEVIFLRIWCWHYTRLDRSWWKVSPPSSRGRQDPVKLPPRPRPLRSSLETKTNVEYDITKFTHWSVHFLYAACVCASSHSLISNRLKVACLFWADSLRSTSHTVVDWIRIGLSKQLKQDD